MSELEGLIKRAIRKHVPAFLVWSNHHGCWWGPNQTGYTSDVWRAGRYTTDAALACLKRGSWPLYGQEKDLPPEVVVLAPEVAQELTVEFLGTVKELMEDRVTEATLRRVANEVPIRSPWS